MNPILEAAAEIDRSCTTLGLKFCFIGGLAVLRWGEPRLTRDVDLTVVCAYGSEDSVIDPLLELFASRIDDARPFALRHRVLLLQAANAIPIDIALGALPFEERAAERASRWQIEDDLRLLTCGPEDLVVHKVFAGRDRDWLDVEGVIERRRATLDRQLIHAELRPLLELNDSTHHLVRMDALFDRA